MRLFEINELSHAYVGKSLFNRAELMVQDGEHIGLVGPNGCGKTTFLKILLGEVIPDTWKIETNGKLRIGRLDQYADIKGDHTVYSYLHAVYEDLFELEHQANAIYAGIPALSESQQLRAAGRAQQILDILSERGFERIEKNIDNVLAGLGFAVEDRDKPAAILSGGQKTKLVLAKLLLEENDLLVLDEPTNFLDIRYIGWLGDYLSRLRCAYIVISHDRAFLNRISSRIVEIANHTFKSYEGNYEQYLSEKQKRDAMQLQQHFAQQKFIKKSEEYVARFESGASVVSSKATWMKKMLQRLDRIEKPDEIVKPRFEFRYRNGATEHIMTLESVEAGYNGIPVLPPVSLTVARGDKVIFKGFNGIGKTTLLKTIAGDLPPISGRMEFGNGIVYVFLKQEEDYENNFSILNKYERRRLGIKDGRQRAITVIEFAKEYYPEKSNRDLQKSLFSCGLNEVHFYEQVRRLSGGEMTRLRLCLAMTNPVNLILLDEPTNHLDVYSKEVLMHALKEFEGTVMMTTHDVNADISWASKVIDLEKLFS